MDITGQRVVVIGGTAGIGLAVAEAAAQKGASVIVASRSQDKLNKALQQIPQGAEGRQVDMADEAAVKELFQEIGKFDHLVYTAGTHLTFQPLRDITIAEAHAIFEDRFWMPFTAIKHAAAYLRPDTGSIVLTSGIATVRPVAGVIGTASAASALESMVRVLAFELAPVRVNAVRVGPLETAISDDPERAEFYRKISEKLLTGRFGTLKEAAAAYLYLMEGGFATGTVLTTDGGYILG